MPITKMQYLGDSSFSPPLKTNKSFCVSMTSTCTMDCQGIPMAVRLRKRKVFWWCGCTSRQRTPCYDTIKYRGNFIIPSVPCFLQSKKYEVKTDYLIYWILVFVRVIVSSSCDMEMYKQVGAIFFYVRLFVFCTFSNLPFSYDDLSKCLSGKKS